MSDSESLFANLLVDEPWKLLTILFIRSRLLAGSSSVGVKIK